MCRPGKNVFDGILVDRWIKDDEIAFGNRDGIAYRFDLNVMVSSICVGCKTNLLGRTGRTGEDYPGEEPPAGVDYTFLCHQNRRAGKRVDLYLLKSTRRNHNNSLFSYFPSLSVTGLKE